MTSPTKRSAKEGWAMSGLVFAATMMMIVGAFQFFQGIAAIAKSEFFLVTPSYAFKIDTSVWGWIHLILGAAIAVAGFYLFTGADWARGAAIALAAFSALSQFFFLPYYPLWAIVIIALDVFVIWAVTHVPNEHISNE
jgi:hypothetical protein